MHNDRIPENVAAKFDHLVGKANRRAIFFHFRDNDESHLWPIRGRFNATARAIGRLYRFESLSGQNLYGLELCLYLDDQISNIVNTSV